MCNSDNPVPPPVLVTAREHLEEVCDEMRAARARGLAVDVESNGFYAYREKVCLIQLSTSENDYIVDPIAIRDMSALGPLFADPAVEKIFHAGEYDILCLKRDFEFRFARLFDTMIASRLLGSKELGLAAAIERHFGIRLSKKLQRADWGRRPLTMAQIRYAQLDTHYLLRLADIQRTLLEKKELLEDAAEGFEKLARLEPQERTVDPEAFRRLAQGRDFDGRKLAVLREIHAMREEAARERDRAPFRIMPEPLMVKLAEAPPDSMESLRRFRGMTPYLFERFGRAVLEAIRRGQEAPPIALARPHGPRPDPRLGRLFEHLRAWRKAKAEQLGVDPVDVVTTEQLREIGKRSFSGTDPLHGLSELKRRRYGSEILKSIAEFR